MHQEMIRMWNEQVGVDDTVYILGDVAFCNVDTAVSLINSLNGTKILIKGNHDRKLMQDPKFRACFKSTHDYLDINYNGTKVVMLHYPICEWDQMHRGSVHFYGHLHQREADELKGYRALNVGWDCTGSIVNLMDVMVARALKGNVKEHH